MKDRWPIAALSVIGVVALIILAAQLAKPRQPEYKGRPLDFWVESLLAIGADQEEARAAIRTIGSEAVPFLLAKVRAAEWQEKKLAAWSKLPTNVQEYVPAAAPDSDLLLNKVPYALSLLGEEVLPQLLAASHDPNSDIQAMAVHAIGQMGPRAHSALPRMVQLLQTTNDFVREGAALAIGRMGPIRTQAIPALVTAAPTTLFAVRALGGMGPAAESAVPQLMSLSAQSRPWMRLEAFRSLWRIQQDPALALRVAEELDQRKQGIDIFKGYVALSGEMGVAAKPAIPALLRGLTNYNLPRRVYKALLRIDPQAAATIESQVP